MLIPHLKLLARRALLLVFLIGFIAAACLAWIEYNTRTQLYSDIQQLPKRPLGLVLGTSPWQRSGDPNLFFQTRMQAAADLYHAGKVKALLVSGDNRHVEYNEPIEMRNALIELNVPDDKIILDYAGFRTLDSVMRADLVFGQKDVTIISQGWHNKRALYIANQQHMNAVAYNAANPPWRYSLRTLVREYPAKLWMLIEVHIMGQQPTHSGPPEPINGQVLT